MTENESPPPIDRSAAFAQVERYCMFFGYPRSGHTLVGSLLNAHPEILICHELDVLSHIREGITRETLFREIHAADQRFAELNREHTDYDYKVPGGWQGRWTTLRVIGDKKGGRSSWWLHDEPDLLERLYATVRLPIRFFHVSRSPWDNIATMVRRGLELDRAIAWYFETCEAVQGIKARIPGEDVFDLRHEDLIREPRPWLRRIAAFLEVTVDEQWVEACAPTINARPRRSRYDLEWSPVQQAEVQRQIPRFPWLRPDDLEFNPHT